MMVGICVAATIFDGMSQLMTRIKQMSNSSGYESGERTPLIQRSGPLNAEDPPHSKLRCQNERMSERTLYYYFSV